MIRGDRMKIVFKVFKRDLRTITKNIAALIIIIGLCLLPSLYAWINIYACWDPYSNTGNLPVAIVNNDEGAVFSGKVVNVGDSVIEQLKKNKSIGWDFVDEWQANYGLNEGKYYALIEIPRNFSTGLISLSSGSPQKPAVVYRVNEKLNAIAGKITNVARDNLVNNIKSNFESTVNEQVITTLKSEAEKSQIDKSKVLGLKNTFTDANDDITALKKQIADANSNSASLQKSLNTVNVLLPKTTKQINSLEEITQASKSLTVKTKQTIESISTDLNSDIMQMQSLNDQNKALLSQLKNINSNTINNDVIKTMKQTGNICDSIHAILIADMGNIKTLNKSYDLSSLTFLVDSLNYMDQLVVGEGTKLTKLEPIMAADSSKDSVNSAIDDLSKISDELFQQTQNVSNVFYSKGSPILNNVVSNLSLQLDDTNSVIESTKVILPQLNALAIFATASSQLSVQQANEFSGMLTSLQTDLNKLLDKMGSLTNEKTDKLIDIIQNHPSEIANFISSPLEVKEEEIYDMGIFGVGLTPFYSVLAIWVGSLLLCALLSVECEDFESGVKLNMKQKHFGKMILFLFLSLIQSVIISLGDIFILGVKPESFWLMMLFTVLASITFTVIIFTLTSIFGNVGKAIAVIAMVFQIAGSGGIYPIQTNPQIFGALQPLWPFTYAINGFREAIAGPVWKSVFFNIAALLAFIAAFLLLAILKKPFHKVTMAMEHKFKEADL